MACAGETRLNPPKSYGPHKTLYNRFVRWGRAGIFDKIFMELTRPGPGDDEVIMIDAPHLKAHRTAANLLKKGLFPGILDTQKAA